MINCGYAKEVPVMTSVSSCRPAVYVILFTVFLFTGCSSKFLTSAVASKLRPISTRLKTDLKTQMAPQMRNHLVRWLAGQ